MHLVPKENGALSITSLEGVSLGIWIPINCSQTWDIAKIKVSNTIHLFLLLENDASIQFPVNPILSLSTALDYFNVYDSHGDVIEERSDVIQLLYDECEDEKTREELLDMF